MQPFIHSVKQPLANRTNASYFLLLISTAVATTLRMNQEEVESVQNACLT